MAASKEEIKSAYLKKAKEHHPDKNPDDPMASIIFQEIQEAHSVIGNNWKRGLYDTDLRFAKDGPASASGPIPGDLSEDEWKKRFNAETEDQKLARRERYKRYAAGEREDIPYDQFAYIVPFVVLGTIGAFYFIAHEAPKYWGPHHVEDFSDLDTSDELRGVKLVKAFHNPIIDKWERLPEGYKPPTPYALFKYYESHQELLPMSKRKKAIDPGRLPVNQLTLLNSMEETRTVMPTLLIDEKSGDFVIWNKETKSTELYSSSK